jgi:hypothetical protein
MDADGNVLTAQRDRTVKGFEESLVKLASWSDLKKKADGGDKAAKAELVVLELEMGKLEADAAKAALKDLPALKKDVQARFDTALIGAEVAATMKGKRKPDEVAEAGRKFAEMLKAGRTPKGDASLQFYNAIMQAAETDGDAKLFETALKAMQAEHGEKPNIKRYCEQAEKRLADLKAGKKPEPKGGAK